MIKVCSLDFLNRDTFDTEVMSADGKILFGKKDKITPGILLSLYFQEIFTEKDLCELEKEEILIQEKIEEERKEKEAYVAAAKVPHKTEKIKNEEENTQITEEAPQEQDLPLVFDEERAAKISRYASLMGKAVGLSPDKLKELEQAAFYYDTGKKNLKQSDLAKEDFKKLQAKASYEIMVNEMNLPEQIAEVSHLYLNRYESKDFKLEDKGGEEIPYANIVAIADYYDELTQKAPKEEALLKMLQLGGNKFNVFVLHKFVHIMRNENG